MRVSVTEAHPREVEADAVVQVFEPPLEGKGPLGVHLSTRGAGLVVPDSNSLTWLESRRMQAPRIIMASRGGTSERVGADGWNGTLSDAERTCRENRCLRTLGATIERGCFENDVGHVVLAPTARPQDVIPVLEGMLLRAYGPTEFRKKDIASTVGRITVCTTDRAGLKPHVDEITDLARATNLSRALADLPANIGTPEEIVARTRKTAGKVGLGVEALEPAALEELGMGLMLGVSRGSGHPCRLLILEHRPAERLPTLVLVGKGLTHDTGGYDLKRTGAIARMTYDKAGGMAVIGAMHGIARRNVAAHVVAVVPLLENCVDANAYKPGDILRAMDGTSVYVDNTDAEGRLALADCLTYVKRFRPRLVVDIATLTGSGAIALGDPFAALFSNNDRARDLMLDAGQTSDDLLWPLPIHATHRGQLSHHKAQLANVGPRAGGASSAAAFLQHFVRFPWAHVDMAGKAATDVERDYVGRGATGFGTRLLVRAAQRFARDYARGRRSS